jgi:hypothetical protein
VTTSLTDRTYVRTSTVVEAFSPVQLDRNLPRTPVSDTVRIGILVADKIMFKSEQGAVEMD